MKRERLLRIKKNVIKNKIPWYLKMSDEDIGSFSARQLELICEIATRSEALRESCSPFYSLSATEVLQKSSNRIAEFTDNGVTEVSQEEIISGAAGGILKNFLDGTEKEPLL